ncbi:hypothetical protein GCM10010193_37020 [Kitasatospora atroaurantiaca]|uniref:hypothetical protein n=1 Tax=Kitasatospora atroaurantiaca TaxID=285545 RepID=UPI0011A13AB6|nr:hypothetical protein [Kitasatospora atroaurantiaca]
MTVTTLVTALVASGATAAVAKTEPAVKTAPAAKPASAAKPGPTAGVQPRSALPGQPNLAGGFVPSGPTRLLDTRYGIGTDGVVAPIGQVPLVLDVSGVSGNPSVKPTAVVLNVTVTKPSAGGYLSVYPWGGGRPATSNLNFTAGQTIPNLVTVPVGTDGKVALFNAFGTADVIADLAGYYTVDKAATTYVANGPTRLLDTREGVGTGGVKAPVGQGRTISLTVGGVSGIPAGARAVTLNVTATKPTAGGFLTVFPHGQSRPTASNLNFTAGQTVPNLVTVPVGTDGKVDFFNFLGDTDVIADLAGYYLADAPQTGGVFRKLDAPTRLLDTREGVGTGGVKAPVGQGRTISLTVGGVSGIPAGARAVTLNVTATRPTAGGFLTVFPHGQSRPTASNLNFTAGQTVPNLVTVPVGADGKVDFFNFLGDTDVVADVFGYYISGEHLGLSALSFDAKTVDASAGGATVDVKWTVTDSDPAARQIAGSIVIRQQGDSPDSYVGQSRVVEFLQGQSLYNGAAYLGGDAASSSYSYQFVVPQYAGAASAKWVVSQVSAVDIGSQEQLLLAGSALTSDGNVLTATEQVANATPSYDSMDVFTPVSDKPYLYNGVAASLNYRLNMHDAQSGIWRGSIEVTGPGGRTLRASFEEQNFQAQQWWPCQHDINYATCDTYVNFPGDAPAGTWSVSKVALTNNAGLTKTFTGLNEKPITLTSNGVVSADRFSVSSTQLNNWGQDAPFKVGMRVSGARGGVSSVEVLFSTMGGYCRQTSATPVQEADGSYSVSATLYRASNGASKCKVTGVVVRDGAGDLALYGTDFNAPDPALSVASIPVTTAPVVKSAELNVTTIAQSQIGNRSFLATVQVEPGVAPVNGDSSYLYNSSGVVVGQSSGGTSQTPDGKVNVSLYVPYGLAVGSYTVGFSLSNAAGLVSYYGMPGKPAVPGGPLVLTVTAG